MLQWIQQNLGIIIIALSFGVSGLGWLLQQLKQAQEKKKAEQLRQRARLEALRTGRIESQSANTGQQSPAGSAGQAQAPPRQRLEDMARRRQQAQQQRSAEQRTQLEEQLRRRREAIEAQRKRQQEQRQRQLEARRNKPQPQPKQGRPPQRQASKQRPDQRRSPQPQSAQPARRPAERRAPATPPSPTEVPIQQTVITDVIEAKRKAEAIPVQAPIVQRRRPGIAPALGFGFDLRQAIIMREILDKPIGMRGPADESF